MQIMSLEVFFISLVLNLLIFSQQLLSYGDPM